MLTSIQLENYRGFRKYALNGFSRVNLLVGKNNCGKTSVLEGIHYLASGGEPRVLTHIAERRGEMDIAGPDTWVKAGATRSGPKAEPNLSHFLHGHKLDFGSSFSVRSDGDLEQATARVIAPLDVDMSALLAPASDVQYWIGAEHLVFALVAEGRLYPPGSSKAPVLFLSKEGGVRRFVLSKSAGRARPEGGEGVPVHFTSPSAIDAGSLARMWDGAVKQGKRAEVIEALRVIEPDVSDIYFSPDATASGPASAASIFVTLSGGESWLPLGTLGEGMSRLLALSLPFAQAARGIVLVDEIDTGLHYSIMGDMWRVVVETAKRSDVQVFATTHSLDCVRGLAWLCEKYPELGSEVSLQKIVPSLPEAVAADAKNIVIAAKHDIEMR